MEVKWSVSFFSLCCVEFCQRLDRGPGRDLDLCLCLGLGPYPSPCPSLDLCLCHNLGLCRVPSPSLGPFHVLGYRKGCVASELCLDLGCDL